MIYKIIFNALNSICKRKFEGLIWGLSIGRFIRPRWQHIHLNSGSKCAILPLVDISLSLGPDWVQWKADGLSMRLAGFFNAVRKPQEDGIAFLLCQEIVTRCWAAVVKKSNSFAPYSSTWYIYSSSKIWNNIGNYSMSS